jgi:hypothetical protein
VPESQKMFWEKIKTKNPPDQGMWKSRHRNIRSRTQRKNCSLRKKSLDHDIIDG